MASTLLSDYMQKGTHATRIATTPVLGTKGIGLFYETDTFSTWLWNGSAWVTLSPLTPTVVQSKAAAAASLVSAVMATAPVQGNLLVAFVGSSAAIAAASGWTVLTSLTSGVDQAAILIKVAGASESTTQTPIAAGSTTTEIGIWEINGARLGLVTLAGQAPIAADFVGTTPVTTSIFAAANQLLLYGFLGSATGTPTVSGGALDQSATMTGRQINIGHTTANSGYNACTATFSGSGTTKAFSLMLTV